MAQNTRSNEGASTSRRSHSREQDCIDNFLERFILVLVLVPSTLIKILSDQFNGWLGAVFFLCWHVQVINQQYTEILRFGAVLSFSDLVEFTINDLLSLHRGSLSRETHFDRHIFFGRQLVENEIFDVDRFSSSSGSTEQERDFILNIDLNQV
jgi:hypothetical protein